MNMGGRDGRAVELKLPGRAGIVDGHGFIAQIIGRADRGVDAHMAHRANRNDFFDTVLLQKLLQAGLAERVGKVLGDDRLALAGGDRLVDLHAVRAGHKDRCAGHLVADVHDQCTGLAPMGDHPRRIGGGVIDVFQRQVAVRPVFILQIDHDDCALCHGISFSDLAFLDLNMLRAHI